MTDSDLVRRTLDGDPHAFTLLADRHTPACLRFAARMLGGIDDAEDATQDTLVRAYRALATFDGRTAFRTWLFAILVNRCRSMLAGRTRRRRWFASDDGALARAVAPDDGSQLRLELAAAIEGLPVEQREAFLLKHVEGLEYVEMADVTGVGVSALKMRVQRACTRLRTELRERDHAG